MTDYMSMFADLIEFCRKNGVEVNSIQTEEQRTECDLNLTWYKKGHDGSKCKKLCIPELEGVEEQLDKLTLRKQKKVEVPVEVPVEEGKFDVEVKPFVSEEVKTYKDLKKGDYVLYYGDAHRDRHGEKAAVKAAYREDNVVVRFLSDDMVTSAGANKLKKVVYVNGA